MTLIVHVVTWVARKLGVQITLAGRRVGMADDEFVATWEKVRARGLTRYSLGRAVVAAVTFGLVLISVGMVRAERTDWTNLFYVPLCFVIVALLAPVRWYQHEDRFLRLTAPWVVKRFD